MAKGEIFHGEMITNYDNVLSKTALWHSKLFNKISANLAYPELEGRFTWKHSLRLNPGKELAADGLTLIKST